MTRSIGRCARARERDILVDNHHEIADLLVGLAKGRAAAEGSLTDTRTTTSRRSRSTVAR